MKKGGRVTRRTADRLQRAAFEYEYLAGVFRAEGYDSKASSLREIASRLGEIGRDLAGQFMGDA